MKIHKITSQQLVRNERYIQKKSRGGGGGAPSKLIPPPPRRPNRIKRAVKNLRNYQRLKLRARVPVAFSWCSLAAIYAREFSELFTLF